MGDLLCRGSGTAVPGRGDIHRHPGLQRLPPYDGEIAPEDEYKSIYTDLRLSSFQVWDPYTPLRQLDYGETGRMEVEYKDTAWAEAHPGSAQRQRRGVLFSPVSPGRCGKLPAGCPGFAAGIAGGFPPFSPPVVENPAAWWYTYYKESRIREEVER